MGVEVAQYVAAETLLAELLEDDREQAAVPAAMVDDDELGWLAFQRRKQGGVVESCLNLIPTGQVVPELHDYLGIIANEVVEQEVPGRDLSTSPTRLMLLAASACTRREFSVR